MKTIAIFELACALFVAIAIVGQLNNRDKSRSAKWLRLTLLFAMIHLVIDALAYTLAGPDYPFALRYAVNFLAYSMPGIDMLAFIMYCNVFISSKANVKRVTFLLPLIAAALCSLACVVLFVAGQLIVYESGIAVAVNDIPVWLRLFEILIMLYTPAIAIRFRKEIGWKAAALMGFYCFTPIISGIVAIYTGVDYSIIIGAVAVLLVSSVVQDEERRGQMQTAFEKEREFNRIIGALSKDYTGINYVELTDDENADVGISYRTSDLLEELLPNEDEIGFTAKILALSNTAVYEPDREQFFRDTRRDVVIEALGDSDTYTLYPRLFIDGEIVYYELKFSAIREDGKLTAIVAGLRSIDEEKRKELESKRQLEEALAEAESASRAKSEFLFSMSHDVRTPMNAITGFTSMAVKHIDDREKALDCLEKTQKASGMLLSLINSVLEMSRIESGHAVLEQQPGDVYYSFVNIENTMREMAEAKDIALSFEFGDIRDRFVYADFGRCMRIFVNIISNAIKYTPEGGAVEVRCEQLGEAKDGVATYRYTISDNGIGMSEEFQKHIFEQFSREQTSTVSGIQGSGLGMSVVKSFVDLMGGTIEVHSKQGEGSTFTIILPFALQEKEEYTDPATGEVVLSSRVAAKEIEEHDFAGKKVLLVEDNELNREIAIEILEDKGLVVEDADDGTTAVEKLREKGPSYYDFVLMDIQMPTMNGYEATRAIRELYPEAKLPIIALSANAFAEDKQKSLEAGMDDHVAKPIEVDELFAALARFA